MTKIVTIEAQQKWEYRLESRKTESSLLKTLNELGQQGWELVEVLYYKDLKAIMTWTGFMKRPCVPQPQQGGEGSAILTKAEPLDESAPLGNEKGFDLSGDEFPLAEEKPPSP
ncbi:MAG: hypothetical protein JW959_00905 [Pirellulales bacterium]|nr:hypothetical protein [Pirellulales bacterium]